MNTSDTTSLPDFTPAARAVTGLLEAIGDERLGDPTPCPEYAVRELLAHVDGLCLAFRDAARKALGPTTDTSPDAALPVLEDGWRARIPVRLNELAEAWRRPEAWQGMTRAGGVDLPADIAGRVALNELVIHGWDLARATGQAYDPGEASAAVSYEIVRPTDDDSLRDGIFGPPVAVPDDASLLDRVVGFSGRRPDWHPAG
ncbi:TIGR03086 family metal-binding protein [Streptomyces sp. NPDC096176]|uniref:TIGR03086 family metal-binding protein n=1 Tax=Streptomyces sp. NPDC096176 TaxID=3366079 RepID=UPI0037FD5085